MYAVTIFPLDNRILAVFRWPEFGFLGLVMPTFKQTPLRAGRFTMAGDAGRRRGGSLRGRRRICVRVARVVGDVEKGRWWRERARWCGRDRGAEVEKIGKEV